MRFNTYIITSAVFIVIFMTVLPNNTYSQIDPSGTKTGTLNDVPAATAGQPTLEEVADAVGHNRISINFVWTLIAAFLVMFMQAGFAMVEAGFTQAKNVAHTMGMNLEVLALLLPWAGHLDYQTRFLLLYSENILGYLAQTDFS